MTVMIFAEMTIDDLIPHVGRCAIIDRVWVLGRIGAFAGVTWLSLSWPPARAAAG